MLTNKLELRIAFVRGYRQLEFLPANLTEDLLNENMYWFAPEVLRAMEFTMMTDVWAYGVTVWELLTRGCAPYTEFERWEGIHLKIKNTFRRVVYEMK